MSVSIVMVRSLLSELEARGLDAEGWLSKCQITRARTLNAYEMLSYEEARAAVRSAVEISGDPAIGHAAGLRTPASALPAISPLLLSQSTVRDAAMAFIRYARLVSEGPLYVLKEDGASAIWGFTAAMQPNEETRVMADYALALTTSVARMLQGAPRDGTRGWGLRAVWFRHAEPSYSDRYRETYGCPVLFERELNALEFTREILDEPLPFADEGLRQFLREPVEKTLREASRRQSWTDRVRFVLHHTESFVELDLAAVAERVQASERTLRRALEREQTSFASLLDEARERVAREKLTQGTLSLAEVATLLGYSSQSSFGRAFRAWTGLSPAEYRRGACVETRPESDPSSS